MEGKKRNKVSGDGDSFCVNDRKKSPDQKTYKQLNRRKNAVNFSDMCFLFL